MPATGVVTAETVCDTCPPGMALVRAEGQARPQGSGKRTSHYTLPGDAELDVVQFSTLTRLPWSASSFVSNCVAVADWISPVSEDEPRPDGPRATQTEPLRLSILKGRPLSLIHISEPTRLLSISYA